MTRGQSGSWTTLQDNREEGCLASLCISVQLSPLGLAYTVVNLHQSSLLLFYMKVIMKNISDLRLLEKVKVFYELNAVVGEVISF